MKRLFLLLSFSFLLLGEHFEPISQVYSGVDTDYLFLKDQSEKEWIFKQYRDHEPAEYLDLVFEELASKMADELNIPINHAVYISPRDSFEPRLFSDRPGTLHAKVSGICVEDHLPWEGFDMHQRYRTPFMEKKKGKLDPSEKGLRIEVIRTFAKHPDLAKIAALDTYLGNMDRSSPNLFYDAEHNRFYGIDMGNSFKGNLTELAFHKICQYDEEEQLNPEDIAGLKIYADTLHALVKHFPAYKCAKLLDEYLAKEEFKAHSKNQDLKDKVVKTRRVMRKNYESAFVLLDYLDQL